MVPDRLGRRGEAGGPGLPQARRLDDARCWVPIEGAPGEVRTAGADTPDAVLTAVDAAISGDALDAAAEARATWVGAERHGANEQTF